MNAEKFIKRCESKRQRVIELQEKHLTGSSETSLPALFLIGTAQETCENWGLEMVVTLDNYCDLFLKGFEVGVNSCK